MSLKNYGYCSCCGTTQTLLYSSDDICDDEGHEIFECPSCHAKPFSWRKARSNSFRSENAAAIHGSFGRMMKAIKESMT
jgi:hypothetical protein